MHNNITIQDGIIFMPDCRFQKGSISISEGLFTNNTPDNPEIINAENLYIIPGLTDIHFHGCKGHDFCDGTIEALTAITEYQASIGVTSICPATMTLPENDLINIMRTARNFHSSCSSLVGINLEGPFISPNKIGAQNPKYIIRPSSIILRNLQEESGGLIRIAVVAPEVEGGLEFIEESKNIAVISLAHTECGYDTAVRAFELGASHMTHLYNAMNSINHRAPGPVIAALDNDNVEVELICDGIHIHPAVVRSTLRAFGDDRVIFISDSMEATGMPDGNYMLGGQKVIKNGRRAALEDGHTIAGSVTNLMDCMRTAVNEMNVPLESAVKCSAVNPVKLIGLYDSLGSIEAGKTADLAALDNELNLVWVMKEGRIL